MGWLLRRGSRAAARAGARRGAAGGDRRAEHRRVRARDQPAASTRRRRQVDRIIQRDGDAALRSAGRRGPGGPARHRRLPAGRSTRKLKADGSRPWTRVDVYAANAIIGPDLRPGRRRRGAPLGVLRPAAQPVRHARAGSRSSTTSRSSTIPTRRRRSAARSATAGRTVRARATPCSTRARSSRPARAAWPLARAAALGEQLPDGGREPLDDRPPAVRRRPADRLHVPRPHAGGRHQLPGRAGARRDRARASPATS